MSAATASPAIDYSDLEKTPAAQLAWLSAAVGRGDTEAIRRHQAALQALDWLVLMPEDLAQLRAAQEAAQATQEQPAEDPMPAADQPEPEPEPVAIEEAGPS